MTYIGGVRMSIWKQEEQTTTEIALYKKVNDFFEQLQDDPNLEYREGQHTMALDIVEAMAKKEILLIEAGVGSGKSWGYLVPLLYSYQNVPNFKGFVISTSTKALQEQLKNEIERLSTMLNIPLSVSIAKGRGNYLCPKRLERFLETCRHKEQTITLQEKAKSGLVSRSDYEELDDTAWKLINIDHANCRRCSYRMELEDKKCQYLINRNQWKDSKAIICNHDLLIESLKRDSDDKIFDTPSVLVVDEAHSLEEKIKNNFRRSLQKSNIEYTINHISSIISADEDVANNLATPMIETLNKIFRMISTKAKYLMRKNAKQEIEVLDAGKSGFMIEEPLKEEISYLVKCLTVMENYASNHAYFLNYNSSQLDKLKDIKYVFKDLLLPKEKQKNVYWATFIAGTKDHIALGYIPKNIKEQTDSLFADPNYAKVFTSATLTTAPDDYSYFMRSIGLDTIKRVPIIQEYSQSSPFDYQNNALLYHPTDIISPKTNDHNYYLTSISDRIAELLQITEGRGLVLFTSKKDMEAVFQQLQEKDLPFNIDIQRNGQNTERLRDKFIEDETSVLLATGAFWEGIDVKGPALENVIIPKLPFPVVDPEMEEKAAQQGNGFQIYLNDMIIKLRQGTGRLIRQSTDKGIVSILDSRFQEYQSQILPALPFTNQTDDMEEVKTFAKTKLKV